MSVACSVASHLYIPKSTRILHTRKSAAARDLEGHVYYHTPPTHHDLLKSAQSQPRHIRDDHPRMQIHSHEIRVFCPDEPLHLDLHKLQERIGTRTGTTTMSPALHRLMIVPSLEGRRRRRNDCIMRSVTLISTPRFMNGCMKSAEFS